MDLLNLYIPITKIDAAKRLVYGVATAEQKDRSGEICDYAGTKPLYEKWSGDIAKASDGKSLGNLRAMHGHVAAGKVTAINFNDEAKQIEICAKVVDDAEWTKVEEGVYTGFSQGGNYVKRWKGDDGEQRYIADPVEVSLVDSPCLASATFQMVKADGATEERHFTSIVAETPVITNDQIAAKAKELAKAAGDEAKWSDCIEAARAELVKFSAIWQSDTADLAKTAAESVTDPRDEVEQVWKSKDGTTFKLKADAVKHNADLAKTADPTAAALEQAVAGLDKALGKTPATERPSEDADGIVDKAALTKAIDLLATNKDLLAKRVVLHAARRLEATNLLPAELVAKSVSLWTVADMASLLGQLEGTEECVSSDGFWADAVNVSDDVKARFTALLAEFGDILAEVLDAYLTSMTTEKRAEAEAHNVLALDLVKAGARHSKTDKANLQKAHDALVSLGADCGDAAKAVDAGALTKMEGDNADLRKMVDTAVGKITEAVAELAKRDERISALEADMKKLKDMPMPGGPARLQVIGKGNDDLMNRVAAAADANDPNAVAFELIKAGQARPMFGVPGRDPQPQAAESAAT